MASNQIGLNKEEVLSLKQNINTNKVEIVGDANGEGQFAMIVNQLQTVLQNISGTHSIPEKIEQIIANLDQYAENLRNSINGLLEFLDRQVETQTTATETVSKQLEDWSNSFRGQ